MKYNDNGTIKEIKVKSFDTLPVGAIVEYNGSTIPSGWTDIGNNQIQKTSQYIEGGAGLPSYFTDEIDTGMKWIDGKPLYRKVFTGQFAGGTSTNTTVYDILPITCTVRNLYGTTYPPTENQHRRPINFYFELNNVSSYIGTWAVQDVKNNRWNLAFYYSQGYNTLNYEAVVEYTKTTD